MSTSPRPPHHTRLALLSLLISALTLALSVFIALVLLSAALSIPTLFLGVRPSATFVRLNLLVPTSDDVRATPLLKPRLAIPTAIQAGWTLVTASGSLVGCAASLGLLVARCQRHRRMARLGLAFFCVLLGAAWGGGESAHPPIHSLHLHLALTPSPFCPRGRSPRDRHHPTPPPLHPARPAHIRLQGRHRACRLGNRGGEVLQTALGADGGVCWPVGRCGAADWSIAGVRKKDLQEVAEMRRW